MKRRRNKRMKSRVNPVMVRLVADSCETERNKVGVGLNWPKELAD